VPVTKQLFCSHDQPSNILKGPRVWQNNVVDLRWSKIDTGTSIGKSTAQNADSQRIAGGIANGSGEESIHG
jgi:hypothetical protein